MSRILILLLIALSMVSPVSAAEKYRAVPEVVWFTCTFNGKHVGFVRGQFDKGEIAPYEFQNIILMNLPGRRVVERTWWEFFPDLRPAVFYQKFVAWQAGASVTNIYDGNFNYKDGTLECKYQEYGAQEQFALKLPKAPFSRYAQTLFLAKRKLAPGQTFKFQTYSYRDKRFVTQEIRVARWDAGAKAWVMEARSEESPGAVSTLWFQGATPRHPNGWTLKSQFPGPGGLKIEMRASTRDEAIGGFEKEAGALKI